LDNVKMGVKGMEIAGGLESYGESVVKRVMGEKVQS
jgi:hypothetical protein